MDGLEEYLGRARTQRGVAAVRSSIKHVIAGRDVIAISAETLALHSELEAEPLFEVPAPPVNFIGREAEVHECVGAMLSETDPQPVVVSGPLGAGKSALTFQVAHVLRESQTHRSQLYIDARGIPAGQVAKIVQRHVVFSRSPSTSRDEEDYEITSAYQRVLARDNPLIVVDNVSPVVKASELAPLASHNVIVTCAAAPFLAARNIVVTPLDPLSASMLVRKLLPERTLELASQIGALSDGIPLKIVILAELAYLYRDRSEAEVAAMLRSADWDRSLEAAVGALLDGLPSDSREVLAALCVFTAFFSAASATAVLERADTRDLLSSLRSRALLDWVPDRGLYKVPSVLREYILARSPTVRNTWGLSHALHYVRWLMDVLPSVMQGYKANPSAAPSDIVAPLAAIRAEWDEVEAADRWLAEESARGNKTAAMLYDNNHAFVQSVNRVLVGAVAAEEGGLSPDWLRDRAESFARIGDYDKAVAAFTVALPHYLKQGDPASPARLGMFLLGYIGDMKLSQAGDILGNLGKLMLVEALLFLTEFEEVFQEKRWSDAASSGDDDNAERLISLGMETVETGVKAFLAEGNRNAASELTDSAQELLKMCKQIIEDSASRKGSRRR